VASTDNDHLARTAYEAHRKAHPGSLPEWEDVPAPEKQAWRAAVSAVTNQGEATLADTGRTQSIALQVGDQARVFNTEFTADGYWFVEDLASTNGTWLNNRRIFSAQRLKRGDKVKIGRTLVVIVSV
jgi:FHA domain-containing protein